MNIERFYAGFIIVSKYSRHKLYLKDQNALKTLKIVFLIILYDIDER